MITIVTGGAALPAAVASVYTGLENLEKVRTKYNELVSERRSPEEVITGTLLYATAVGLCWAGGKAMGLVWSNGMFPDQTNVYSKYGKVAVDEILNYIYGTSLRNAIGGSTDDSSSVQSTDMY